jgi:predicted NAD/FAD-binding protein
VEEFDHVVLACHSDQALAILDEDASPAERRVLSSIRYQPNHAVLHTDAALLPRERGLWSAWNYLSRREGAEAGPVSVSYLINRLQPLPFRLPVVVTLNPQRAPAQAKTLASFTYSHPIFDGPAIAAQRELPALSGRDRVWFCGAWGGYGFHEDGLRSGLAVAGAFGCRAPWHGQLGKAA